MLRTISIALLLAAPAVAQPIGPDPEGVEAYVRPNQRIEIGRGRALNLVCMGSGDKTVLFDAGGSDWSVVWALVQPPIARRTRACAYDRAGLGYSDPAPGPRSPSAIVQDMHALVEAAKLPRPVVLVGHSLGGFNVKLYAALHPEDVAGLVLVDAAEDRIWDRTRRSVQSRYGVPLAARVELSDHWFLSALAERYRDCAAAAKTVDLDPVSLTYRRCSDPPRPQLGPKIAAARQLVQIKAAYQAAQASEIAWSAYNDREMDHVYAGLFRKGAFAAKPMVVLTHEEVASDDPEDRLNWEQGLAVHRESVALSSRGTHRIVSGSGHYIELDRPAVVIEAINSVLDQIAAP